MTKDKKQALKKQDIKKTTLGKLNTYKATTVFKHLTSNTKNRKSQLKNQNFHISIFFFKNTNSDSLVSSTLFLQLIETIKTPKEQKNPEKKMKFQILN